MSLTPIASPASTPMRLPMPMANPFEGAVVGQLYKDAMADAEVGDTLKCVHADTGPTFFLKDKLYPVVLGEQRATFGEIVIKDEEDIEVPHHTWVEDLFVLIKADPVDSVPVAMPEVDTVMLDWAIRGLEAEHADLNETYDSFVREKNSVNKFDADLSVAWGDMSREAKADLLLAQHEGRKIQWATNGFFNSSTWNTMLDSDFTFNDDVCYRLLPSAVESYDAEMKAIREELDTVVDLMNDYRVKTEDEWFF